MCQWCRDNPNATQALTRARAYARAGNRWWARYFIQRAQSFAGLSSRQLSNVNRLLAAAGEEPLEVY